MQIKLPSVRQRSNQQSHPKSRKRLFSRLFVSLLILGGFFTLAQAQQTHWLGRLVGTEYVFDIPLPADFAAMLTCGSQEYQPCQNFPKPSTEVIDGETYNFVTTGVGWDQDRIDSGSIAYAPEGFVADVNWWRSVDASSAEWQSVAQEVKNQANVRDAWKDAQLLVLVSLNAETPMVRMSIFGEQERYWLGRPAGTEYVFDTPLPPEFAEQILAADPNRYHVDKTPRAFSPQTADGAEYSFVTAQLTYDKPQFDRGQVALARKQGTNDMLWIDGKFSSTVGEPLAERLPAPQEGQWTSVDVVMLVSSNAAVPTVRAPIPATTLAKSKMGELGQATKSGLYYPSVQVPADLDAFRAAMLAYGNAGRRDPNFRADNGSKTVTDLSLDTVATLGPTPERVFRQSESAPYFTDHVLDDKLNQAAQFQAEYQAYTNRMGHDGPRSFTDPNTGRSGDLSTLGKRAEFFGAPWNVVEAAGGGAPGNAPHSWMSSDTHFRPWFNVDGCYPRIGYGAARTADGTWYYAAVPERDAECLNVNAAAPTPASATTDPTGTNETTVEAPEATAGNNCSIEADLRSLNWDSPVTFTISNESSEDIFVIWIDYEGQRDARGPSTIARGEAMSIDSFATHPFVITNAQGNCVHVLKEPADLSITGAHLRTSN